MSESTMSVVLPRLPELSVFNNPANSILTACGKALLIYDPATATGIIYNIERGRWSITTPVEFDLFAGMTELAGYALQQGRDAERWMRACGFKSPRVIN